MISPQEALDLVLANAEPGSPRDVSVSEALGLVLAEDVLADRDYPAFPRAMMDGYAVPAASEGRVLTVVGEVAAGCAAEVPISEGHCVEIMTGACCPPGTYAVVQREQVRPDERGVMMPKQITAGQHISPPGSECAVGRPVLRIGDHVTSLAIAVLASVGRTQVRVIPRVRLGVVVTGSELVPPEATPTGTQIRDGNGPMLTAMARIVGIAGPRVLRTADETSPIADALRQMDDREVILISGGVSVGRYDLVPGIVAEFGAETVFHKVAQKPGKPLLLARRGRQLIFGLPGNPLSCHLCFHRYVAPAVRRMQGMSAAREVLQVPLAEPLVPKRGRTHFVPGRLETKAARVRPLPTASSADVFGPSQANSYIELAAGHDEVPAETLVPVTLLDGVENTTVLPLGLVKE
jgi:molybdopterin molybdotransferase